MRWMWIDRIVELVPRTRLVAVKNVSMAEEQLHQHFAATGTLPALPLMPACFIVEGMAHYGFIDPLDAEADGRQLGGHGGSARGDRSDQTVRLHAGRV